MRDFILYATLAGAAYVAASPVARDALPTPAPTQIQKRDGQTQKYFKPKNQAFQMDFFDPAVLKTTYIATMTIPAEGTKVETKIPYLVATGTVDINIPDPSPAVEKGKRVAAVKFLHYQGTKVADFFVALDDKGELLDWHPGPDDKQFTPIYRRSCAHLEADPAGLASCSIFYSYPAPASTGGKVETEEVQAEVLPLDQASDTLKKVTWIRKLFDLRYTQLEGGDEW